MTISISASLLRRLPEKERAEPKAAIEEALWNKSGGRCFLCEGFLNRAADMIELDHDIPEDDDGPTELANLNLTHQRCNRFKRAAKTVPVRPFLKLRAFMENKGGRLKYGDLLEHFSIDVRRTVLTRSGTKARFEFADGAIREVDVMDETNQTGTFEYVFVEAPRCAIFNDGAVQPRMIKDNHVWAIYTDILRNPLHEPPSLRIAPAGGAGEVELLMFDGQHKTVANWLMDRNTVVVKIYLNLETEQANALVNSIQAKIKKLPLSAFELAAKMSDEWKAQWTRYEVTVGTEVASEQGFVRQLPEGERNRGKSALESAILQNVLGGDEDPPLLRFLQFVEQPGQAKKPYFVKENQFRNKVLKKLLEVRPVDLEGEEAQAFRDREAANVRSCLNEWVDLAFEPQGDTDRPLTEVEEELARRMSYQASLEHVATLIRQMFCHVMVVERMGERAPTDDEWRTIHGNIKKIVNHPVWKAPFARDARMEAVQIALQKNQDRERAFNGVHLDLPYLILPKTPAFKEYWES